MKMKMNRTKKKMMTHGQADQLRQCWCILPLSAADPDPDDVHVQDNVGTQERLVDRY